MSVWKVLILFWSATLASKFIKNDDFWPPLQEQWRCMHTPEQHSNNYVLETNYLVNYFENPDVDKIDFECPVIDPNDPEWCPENSNGEYYRVYCNCHAYYRCEVHSSVPPYTPKPCIYKCLPHDLVFDPNTKSCVRKDVAPPGTCFDTSTPRPTSTTTAIPTTTSPKTTPNKISTITHTTPKTIPTITHTTPKTISTITHTTPKTISTITHTTPKTIPTITHTTPKTIPTITHTTPKTISTITHTTPKTIPTITHTTPKTIPTITHTTPPPDEWYHIETLLEGGRYLTLMDDHRNVEMYGRNEHSGQLWRIEGNGCLRNRNHPTRCLAILGDYQGAPLEMLEGNGQDEQHWTFTDDNYIVSKLRGLVLDVIWADVPLITDGASVRVWHEDDTPSEKWKFVLKQ